MTGQARAIGCWAVVAIDARAERICLIGIVLCEVEGSVASPIAAGAFGFVEAGQASELASRAQLRLVEGVVVADHAVAEPTEPVELSKIGSVAGQTR